MIDCPYYDDINSDHLVFQTEIRYYRLSHNYIQSGNYYYCKGCGYKIQQWSLGWCLNEKCLICIILAALLLSACSCGAPAPSESAAPAPSESESQLSFPEAGHILDVDCSGNVLPEDDGTRSVRLRWVTSESEELSHDFPLSGTPSGEAAPVLRLRQEWSTGALVFWDSTPVSDTEDRAYILGLLENSAFSSTEEGLPNLILTVTDGETTTEYPVFAKDAAEDFFRLSALAYKYAAPQTLTAGDWGWNAGFDTDYRLCLRSGELHADLDRAQALVLLRALFGEVGQSAAFRIIPAHRCPRSCRRKASA